MTNKDKELEENIKFLAKCCHYEYNDIRIDAVLLGSLDLITRQQAKIDDLMERNAVTTLIDDAVIYTPTLDDYNKFKKEIKSEAYKEFAERLKELDGYDNHTFDDCVSLLVSEEYKKGRYEKTNEIWSTIDNLVKETCQ